MCFRRASCKRRVSHLGGLVATGEGGQIALFFTGVRHAGENLAVVLRHRAADLPAPIQMCDGLSRNAPEGFDTVMSSCLAHARRKSVELIEAFPDQARFVLETLREVYSTEAHIKAEGLTPEERLARHQAESDRIAKTLGRKAATGAARLSPNLWPAVCHAFGEIAPSPYAEPLAPRCATAVTMHRDVIHTITSGARPHPEFLLRTPTGRGGHSTTCRSKRSAYRASRAVCAMS